MDKEDSKNWKRAIFAVGGAILLWIVYWIAIVGSPYLCGWEQRAQFGSAFGAIAALFSGLAFAVLIVTMIHQIKELKSQRQQLNEQNRTIKQQQFEATFFQLLRLHNDIQSTIVVTPPATIGTPKTYGGRDCFRILYEELKSIYITEAAKMVGRSDQEILEKAYLEFHRQHRNQTAHYFKTLYYIIKFVDRNEDDVDKKFYTALIRAQMSVYERLLLFYNCLSPLGREKFHPLVVQYSLLEHIPPTELIDRSHELFYPKEAYGQN